MNVSFILIFLVSILTGVGDLELLPAGLLFFITGLADEVALNSATNLVPTVGNSEFLLSACGV